ncbi:hypothetical protein QAD02_006470 [Eretmocerus hayati]|uniref:Uncharacterized protein n=1 Tax=Eretmocerus hayati TaxID=131215 RepID=A0ACC2N126_9HYME|nr:hypothetical protein QAD02_006470 [Eretmocerus hayati]
MPVFCRSERQIRTSFKKDISKVVEGFQRECKDKKKYKEWMQDALHHRSQYTTFCWTSAVALLVSAAMLIVSVIFKSDFENFSWPFEASIIILLAGFNCILVISDNRFRHLEILHRVKILLKQIGAAKSKCIWTPENYPHLCSPLSPCITLQWTYRDGHMVNLPWSLLVDGDIIVIKPGQHAPGYCIPYNDTDAPILHAKEVYCPQACSGSGNVFSGPQARTPLRNCLYRLQETPYLTNLRMAFDEGLNRPVTCYNRERHLAMRYCVEQFIYPVLLIFLLIVNFIRFFYSTAYAGIGHWTEMFLIQPVAVSLPLLPMAFPLWWISLNCFGMARFKALFQLYQSSKKAQFLDPFEETSDPNHLEVVYNWTELSEYFWNIMFGREHTMTRSANILHVLGSVTALCCVDKKGILSWPNPTAEKVFFLRNTNTNANSNTNAVSQSSSVASLNKTVDPSYPSESTKQESTKTSYTHHDTVQHTVAEVLDLTHDRALPFKLQFDDPSWRQHLNSLKPLGLAILLNTCNMETQEHYTQFCSHVTCEAMHNENLVPVINRRQAVEEKNQIDAKNIVQNSKQRHLPDEVESSRQTWCLCELAKQIGFKDQAKDIFQLEQQLSTFRHVPEMAKRDIKFARSLSLATKLKFPFPHMVAVVVREKSGAGLQLLTQGTADIIIDSCIEFWDGHDLCPFSESDKKKVQDFYNRTSLTSYCTAFAYRPLTRSVNSKLSDVYLELPSESKHLYAPHRSPTPLPCDFRNVLDPRIKSLLGHFHSTDSLLCNEAKEDEVSSVESCFDLQCNQIFIGMVTMQYQAQTDMVQLIEQLERASIRFVHFSKENELRSRVFSEKMGLESGWNCHISLLSERARSESPIGWWVSQAAAMSSPATISHHHRHNHSCTDEATRLLNRVSPRSNLDNSRQLSMSAPSAINTDPVTVKFENETIEWGNNSGNAGDKSLPKNPVREQETLRSEDSVLVQSIELGSGAEAWRSLSCLTDSTEQSAPVNFDLSNRAKLPRGIDKIRPHIELIDNVPLLVSLFTDCTTAVTREMLHIMQDYGEVVCVLGSSANSDNMPIFMQADAAVAVEPLYPQVCQRVPVLAPTKPEDGPSPIELSRSLNSIACSLSVRREDPIAIYHLVMEARHYMRCVWNGVQFWLCCGVTLSLCQALSALLLLPPIFSVTHVLWLSVLIVPLIAMSLVATPTDPSIMQRATGKNHCSLSAQVAVFVMWCYGSKFLPTIATVLIWQWLSLFTLCSSHVKPGSRCVYVYPNASADSTGAWGGWESRPNALLVVQHIALVIVVLHFVMISVSFVHREYSIWRKLPFDNWIWFLVCFIVICLQSAYSGSVIYCSWKSGDQKTRNVPTNLPLYFLASLPLIFIINEFIKWQEIKVNVRYQKRARLEFTTKLGMNSPF